MYLTTENAHEYEGETLDSSKRLFNDYPYKVFKRQVDGKYCVKTRAGACIEVSEPGDRFNAIYFDIVN